MQSFSLRSPSALRFGAGSIASVPEIVDNLAKESRGTAVSGAVLVLSDKGLASTGAPAKLAEALARAGKRAIVVDTVPPEPTDANLDAIAKTIKSEKLGVIVALGGGSVMDAAKILSVLGATDLKTADLADKGVPLPGSPCVMIPTTAGTGAEATPNAIVLFPERKLKIGIVSPYFVPDCVVLDPELTLGLPKKLTASTGIDAFCHLLECFLGKKANVYSDTLAREGMRLLASALPAAYANGADIEARSAAMLAAYYGGACIAASGTNAVHALSYPLGGTYRIPHGVANAILLVPVMSFQKTRIASRLAEAARAIGLQYKGGDAAAADALVEFLRSLVARLEIPTSLHDLGVPLDALDDLAAAAFGVRRLLDNNPIELSLKDIRAIYESVK
jgi:alcohol dehydrogenase